MPGLESNSNAQGDYPIYILRPDVKRLLLPKTILLIPLGVLLYVAIFLNLKFLNITITTITNMTVIVILLFLISFDLLFEYRKALHIEYHFFKNRLESQNQKIEYSNIHNINVKRDTFDNITETCTFVLDNNFTLVAIPDQLNMYQYINNIIQYNNKSNTQPQLSQNQTNQSKVN